MRLETLQQFTRQPVPPALQVGIGTLLFALLIAVVAEVTGDKQSGTVQEIIVTDQQVARLTARFRATWQRAPTRVELAGLIDDYVREEMLVREARALSLDQDDVVIRRRLSDKMERLIEAAAAAQTPGDSELRAFFEANAEKYQPVPQIAFDQVLIGKEPDAAEVERVLGLLAWGIDPQSLGSRSLLPVSMPLSTRPVVDGKFGPGFFDQLANTEASTWIAPIRSGHGVHVISVKDQISAQKPAFEDVRDKVLADWRAEKAGEFSAAQFARIRNQYRVKRPDLSENGASDE